MTTKPIGAFSIITDKSGKTRVVADTRAAEAKMDLCTRLRRKNSKRVKAVKPSKI